MRESSLEDSSDDFYYTTVQTDIFDFSATDTFIEDKVEIAAKTSNKLLRLILATLNLFKVALFVFGSLFLEVSVFSFTYLHYLQRKIIQLVYFIDLTKDKAVSALMWRRGLIFRPATHGGVMILSALAVVAGGLFTHSQIAAQNLTTQETAIHANNTTQTIVPTNRPRSEMVSYAVASGDTISTLADHFQISVESIKWANNLSDDDINPGQTLKIPPVTGVVISVKNGDTLDSVAKTYSADKQTIADFPFNYIDQSFSLKVGQTLYIPNGSMPQPAAPKVFARVQAPQFTSIVGSGFLSWPVPANISQYFSWFHPAIDIANPIGTPIYAAHAGTIIDAKRQAYSFGWYCIEGFGDGWTIAYAHMSSQYCYVGEDVAQGQLLGAVGETGYATGSHLHFEVRHNGTPVNPLTLLK